MADEHAEFRGWMKAEMKNTNDSLSDIKKSIEGYKKWNIRQDDALDEFEKDVTEANQKMSNKISKLEVNQWWFLRIFTLLQAAAVGLFSWLWSQRF